MITHHEISAALKAVQRYSCSIKDIYTNRSVLINIYNGSATDSPWDYYTCTWGINKHINDVLLPLLEASVNTHITFYQDAELPIERQIFDLSWNDKGHESSKIHEIVGSSSQRILQQLPNINSSTFVRLDGQFFSVVVEDLTIHSKDLYDLLGHLPTSIGITSIFNISRRIVDLYNISKGVGLESTQAPDRQSFIQEIREVIQTFPAWRTINDIGGQLDYTP